VVIALDAALATTRREDLKHGTNAAYVAGCVCKECREHQRVRMAKNGGSLVPSNSPRNGGARVEARRLRSLLRSDARRLRLSPAYHAEHGSLDPT
jgi:hypothetical protein